MIYALVTQTLRTYIYSLEDRSCIFDPSTHTFMEEQII